MKEKLTEALSKYEIQSINHVRHMAMSSLHPIDFDHLLEILDRLAKNRNLSMESVK